MNKYQDMRLGTTKLVVCSRGNNSCLKHGGRHGVRQVRFSAAGREGSRSQMRHYHYELMKTNESSNFEMISGEGAK